MALDGLQSQINGGARVAAVGQLVEASGFYRQSIQTLLIFNTLAFFLCPVLMLLGRGALDETSAAAFETAAIYFFIALALSLLGSFLAHLTVEKRAHAFFIEEVADERRLRAVRGGAEMAELTEAATDAMAREANAHASLSSTSYLASLFALFLAVLAMGAAVFHAMDAVQAVATAPAPAAEVTPAEDGATN